MITCKDGVEFKILRYEMFSRWSDVHAVFSKYGVPMVFTCGTDGHDSDDPHTHGFAYDMRSKHVDRPEKKLVIKEELERVLGPIYTVLLENIGEENEHYHWQVRRDLWRSLL